MRFRTGLWIVSGLLVGLILAGLTRQGAKRPRGGETTNAGEWVAGAIAEVPAPRLLNLEVTRLTTGPGKPVATGDWVHIEIKDLGVLAPGTTDMFSRSAPIVSDGDAAVWIGNLQTARTTFPWASRLTSDSQQRDSLYQLGSADFRAALVGVPTGSTLRVSIALPPQYTGDMRVSGWVGALPRTGFLFKYERYSELVDPFGATGDTKGENFQLQYGHNYEVNIRRACPTRLLVQDVAMNQQGPRLECGHPDWMTFICPVSTHRTARAQYAVLDGRCEQGEALHIGPIAVIDKGATQNPADFKPSILAHLQYLRSHWPIEE
jgi:hypothetical protein